MTNPLNNSQIDEAILSVTPTSWRKVALVMAMTGEILGDNLADGEAGLGLVADRIEAIVSGGLLLAQGNIRKWRHSELRKPVST